jgi:hypothetical protein
MRPSRSPIDRHLLALTVAGLLSALAATTVVAAEFVPTGNMVTARQRAAVTPLADGRVLITGGRISPAGASKTVRAEIYDPATGTFTATGDMLHPRESHSAVLLTDGRVLVLNGGSLFAPLQGDPPTPAEIYDPVTGVFTATGVPVVERDMGSAVRLADGRVLVAGGSGCAPCVDIGGGTFTLRVTDIAEIYDPALGTFTQVGTLTTPRRETTVTMLADGRVLIAGGADEELVAGDPPVIVTNVLDSAEVFDPATGQFTPTANDMSHARLSHAAVARPNGEVLIVYGAVDSGGFPLDVPAETFDPLTDTFSLAAQPGPTRVVFGMGVLLDDGDILFAGGDMFGTATAEIFDAATGTFDGGLLQLPRQHIYHVVAPLPGGRALVAGGLDPARPPVPRPEAEIFVPDAVGDTIFADGFEAPPVSAVEAAVRAAAADRVACGHLAPVVIHGLPVSSRLLATDAAGAALCQLHGNTPAQ